MKTETRSVPTRLLRILLWGLPLLWLLLSLALYFLGNFLPDNWQIIFLLRSTPLWSFWGVVLLGTAYWLNRRGILVYFFVGLLVTLGAVAVPILGRTVLKGENMWLATTKAFGYPYPWRELFVLGILSALVVQLAVLIYFYKKDYPASATFRYRFINILVVVMPFLLSFCVISALIGIEEYEYHISSGVVYLGLVSLWDFSVWKWSRQSSNEAEPRHQKYKKCCKELFINVDGIVFFIVLFWVLLLPSMIRADHVAFSFCSDIDKSQASAPNSVIDTKALARHKLQEPLMAGVVGFAGIFSMLCLVIHFGQWEKERG